MGVKLTDRHIAATSNEWAGGDSFSLHTYATSRRNLNMLKHHATNWEFNQDWASTIQTPAADASTTYLAQWGPLPKPKGFTKLRYELHGQRTAGTNNITMTVETHAFLYTGVQSAISSSTVTINSDTQAWYSNTVDLESSTVVFASRVLYIVLFGKNFSTSEQARIRVFWATLE